MPPFTPALGCCQGALNEDFCRNMSPKMPFSLKITTFAWAKLTKSLRSLLLSLPQQIKMRPSDWWPYAATGVLKHPIQGYLQQPSTVLQGKNLLLNGAKGSLSFICHLISCLSWLELMAERHHYGPERFIWLWTSKFLDLQAPRVSWEYTPFERWLLSNYQVLVDLSTRPIAEM